MSRYLILVLLNLPLIIAAVLNAFVSFNMKHISLKRLVFKVSFWTLILICLIFIQPLYSFLYSEGLTKTEALSLFDVIQITGINLVFFLVNKLYVKVDVLEWRIRHLHQELSIRLSDDAKK